MRAANFRRNYFGDNTYCLVDIPAFDSAKQVLAQLPAGSFQQFPYAPSLIRQSARHRRRLAFERFMLAAEVVMSEENRLHCGVVLQAFGMTIREFVACKV